MRVCVFLPLARMFECENKVLTLVAWDQESWNCLIDCNVGRAWWLKTPLRILPVSSIEPNRTPQIRTDLAQRIISPNKINWPRTPKTFAAAAPNPPQIPRRGR